MTTSASWWRRRRSSRSSCGAFSVKCGIATGEESESGSERRDCVEEVLVAKALREVLKLSPHIGTMQIENGV
jgi:hypothetical protein